MEPEHRRRWQKTRLMAFKVTVSTVIVVVIILILLGSFSSGFAWLGLYHMNFLDWISLLALPLAIVVAAYFVTLNINASRNSSYQEREEASRIASVVAKANPANIQEVAASQLAISNRYYESALQQSQRSFQSALVLATVWTLIIIGSVIFFIFKQPSSISAYGSLIGGIVVEGIAGLNFYLYGQATNQLTDFQAPLDRIGRFLIANSICENIEGDAKNVTRAKLVETIANVPVIANNEENAKADHTPHILRPRNNRVTNHK